MFFFFPQSCAWGTRQKGGFRAISRKHDGVVERGPRGNIVRDDGGKRGGIVGDGIQINRMAERFSSHTLARPRPSRTRIYRDAEDLRETLIRATVDVIAAGGDPRLVQSRAHL
jgi:hypothetical protein